MPVVPVAVVVDGGPVGRQAVLEVLVEIDLLPIAQVVAVLIASPLQRGRIGCDVGGGQVNGSWAGWELEAEVVNIKLIHIVRVVSDSYILGAFGESFSIQHPCVLVVGGHLVAPNEGTGRFSGRGVSNLEGLGIVVRSILIIERHIHTPGALQLGRDEVLGRVGVVAEPKTIFSLVFGVCVSSRVCRAIQHRPAFHFVFLLEAVGVRQVLGKACRSEAEGGLGDEVLLVGGNGSCAAGGITRNGGPADGLSIEIDVFPAACFRVLDAH